MRSLLRMVPRRPRRLKAYFPSASLRLEKRSGSWKNIACKALVLPANPSRSLSGPGARCMMNRGVTPPIPFAEAWKKVSGLVPAVPKGQIYLTFQIEAATEYSSMFLDVRAGQVVKEKLDLVHKLSWSPPRGSKGELLYTFLMLDLMPDSPDSPALLHWCLVDCPSGPRRDEGLTVADFAGVDQFRGGAARRGLHRMVMLAYLQREGQKLEGNEALKKLCEGNSFDLKTFVKELLGDGANPNGNLVAGSYYDVSNAVISSPSSEKETAAARVVTTSRHSPLAASAAPAAPRTHHPLEGLDGWTEGQVRGWLRELQQKEGLAFDVEALLCGGRGGGGGGVHFKKLLQKGAQELRKLVGADGLRVHDLAFPHISPHVLLARDRTAFGFSGEGRVAMAGAEGKTVKVEDLRRGDVVRVGGGRARAEQVAVIKQCFKILPEGLMGTDAWELVERNGLLLSPLHPVLASSSSSFSCSGGAMWMLAEEAGRGGERLKHKQVPTSSLKALYNFQLTFTKSSPSSAPSPPSPDATAAHSILVNEVCVATLGCDVGPRLAALLPPSHFLSGPSTARCLTEQLEKALMEGQDERLLQAVLEQPASHRF